MACNGGVGATTEAKMSNSSRVSAPHATNEPFWVRALLIFLALGFLFLILVVPLFVVAVEALRGGWAAYQAAIVDPDSLSAIKLTLLTAAIVVPINTIFGVAAAWAIAKFRFRGKNVLKTLIDLPFAVSPVISGLIFVILFGRQGILGPFLVAHNIKIIYAVPGIVLATAFVTVPFVARELIAFMEAQGTEEEEAAIVLGASGWQMFRRITLPNIKWGLLYGIILCNARAMGEFGAASVVSGQIRGQTNTIPLQVESLYQDHATVAAFALASVLALLGVVTLVIKQFVEFQARRALSQGNVE